MSSYRDEMREKYGTTKESFREWCNLLIQLVVEMNEGRGDDARADELRDEMDFYFWNSSKERCDVVGQMSADLYDPEVFRTALLDIDAFIQKYESML